MILQASLIRGEIEGLGKKMAVTTNAIELLFNTNLELIWHHGKTRSWLNKSTPIVKMRTEDVKVWNEVESV